MSNPTAAMIVIGDEILSGRTRDANMFHLAGALTEIGVENLIVKLIERGEQAKRVPNVQCEFRKNARVKDRVCTVLQVTQPTKAPALEFYQAQVFIDDAINLPIRYIAYDWPSRPEVPPQVLEEYNYLNLKINVGLTDEDFDPYNPKYSFYSK